MAHGCVSLSLYHEKQVGLLCGQHALNCLLQGPYFTAEDLGAIGREFDEKERNLMREAGLESQEYLRYMAEDSGNASIDGNFSIQVLSKALETWNLSCIPVLSREGSDAWGAPANERGFICNLDKHWLTLRRSDVVDGKVHGSSRSGWWNFNSMFPAPQPVSEIYLAEFLRQLKDEGYGIFVVRGILPDPKGPGHKPPGRNFATLSDSYSGDYGKWVTPTEAASLNKQGEATKKQGLARDAASRAMQRLGGSGNSSFTVAGGGGGFADANAEAEDAELRRAIEASLGGGGGFGAGGTAYGGFGSAGGNVSRNNAHNSSDDDLARALAASLADGGGGLPISSHPVSGSQFTGAKRKTTGETVAEPNAFAEDEDADLAAAIAASIGDGGGGVPSSQNAKDSNSDDAHSVVSTPIPPEPEPEVLGAVDIAVRGEGTRARRRFLESDTIDQVEAWVGAVLGLDMRTNMLCTSFPRKALSDGTMSLAQAGVRDKDALAVAPRR